MKKTFSLKKQRKYTDSQTSPLEALSWNRSRESKFSKIREDSDAGGHWTTLRKSIQRALTWPGNKVYKNVHKPKEQNTPSEWTND